MHHRLWLHSSFCFIVRICWCARIHVAIIIIIIAVIINNQLRYTRCDIYSRIVNENSTMNFIQGLCEIYSQYCCIAFSSTILQYSKRSNYE